MGQAIKLKASDNFELGAYRADPGGTPKGAIVVIQEIFGVNHHIRSVCDRLAAEGYLRFAHFTRAPGMTKDFVLRQNQRSPICTVSPGPIGVPIGTVMRAVPEASVCVRVT